MPSRITAPALLVLFAWPTLGDEPAQTPLLTARMVRPDLELERFLALFRGARASDPAQALAAWKRASQEPKRLGKPLEAAIAAINPRMVRELGSLVQAKMVVASWPLGSSPRWYATLPHDDGTFAALGSALVLSGGAEEDPLAGVPVDRLGPPGSALMARGRAGLIVAGSRDDLGRALAEPGPGAINYGQGPPWRAEIHPGGLDPATVPSLSIPLRLLRAAGCRNIGMAAGLDGTVFESLWEIEVGDEAAANASPINPAWLDLVPREGTVAAFAIAIDPGDWDRIFAVADRFKTDNPARTGVVAPTRLRLAWLARVFGVRFEADVRPHLRGVSGWIAGKALDRGVIAAHFDDEAATTRVLAAIRTNELARLGPTVLGRGSSILVGWGGESIRETVEALDHPDRSAGPTLRLGGEVLGWQGRPPARTGGIWPGRWPGLVPDGSPLAVALEGSPPIVWTGRNVGKTLRERFRWTDLDATVRRFLDLIPMDPPPDR